MSAPDVGQVDLTSGMQQRQVGDQALELLLLVRAKLQLFLTLSIAVRGGVVVGAPFRLSSPPNTARLFFHFSPGFGQFFCTCWGQSRWKCPYALHQWHWLDEDRHRVPPAQDHGPRRVARLLVHVEAVGRSWRRPTDVNSSQ